MASAPPLAKNVLVQAARHDLGDLLGEIGDGLRVINVRCAMDQLVHLLLRGGDDLRIAVAGVDHRNAGEAVKILAAGDVGDDGALALSITMGDDRLHEAGHDVVFIFLDGVHKEAFSSQSSAFS